MNRTEIAALVTKAFRESFGDPGMVLSPEMTPDTIPHWDSHKYVAILIELEDQLNVTFSPRETDRLRTIGDIEALVEQKLE